MSFYHIKMIYRNKKLWLTAFLSILIGLSFLFSAFLIVDYVGQATIKRELEEIKVDISVNLFDPKNLIVKNYRYYVDKVNNLSDIRDNIPLLEFSVYRGNITYNNRIYKYYEKSNHIVFTGIDLERTNELFTSIRGNITGKPYEIALLGSIADEIGVNIGENVTIYFFKRHNGIGNISLRVTAIVQPSNRFYELIAYRYPKDLIFSTTLTVRPGEIFAIFSSIESIRQIYSDLRIKKLADTSKWELFYFIFLDRDKVIDLWNLDKTMNKLQDLMDELTKIFMGTSYYADISDNIWRKLLEIRSNMEFQRIIILYYYWPMLLIAAILASIGLLTTMKSRKPIISILKVKGATISQLREIIIFEGLINGFLAGIIGIILSYLIASFICIIYLPNLTARYSPFNLLIKPMQTYAIPLVITSIIVGFISVYSPSKAIAQLDLSEALHEYTEYIEKEERAISKWTWIITIIGLYSVLEISLQYPLYWNLMNMSKRFFLLYFVSFLVSLFDFVARFIGPVLFAYGISKILSYYFGGISNIVGKIAEKLTGAISYISIRDLARRSRRVVKGIFLIQIVVIFSIFYIVNSDTLYNRGIIEAKMKVGGDVRIRFYEDIPYKLAINVTRGLKNISSIDKVIQVGVSTLYYGYRKDRSLIWIIDVEYFNLKFFDESYLVDTNKEEVINLLNNSNSILFSYTAKRNGILLKGEEISIQDLFSDTVYKAKVIGFLKFAPGLTTPATLIKGIADFQTNIIGLVSFNTVMNIFNISSNKFYVSSIIIQLKNETNITESVNAIKETLYNYSLSFNIDVYSEEIEKLQSIRVSNLSLHLFGIEVINTVFMGVIGIIILIASLINDRRREIALLRSKGASRSQILRLILSEVIVINLIAFSFGLVNGLIYSYAMLSPPIYLLYGGKNIDLPNGYLMTLSLNIPLFVILSFSTIILASIIPVLTNLRRKISEELRIHH